MAGIFFKKENHLDLMSQNFFTEVSRKPVEIWVRKLKLDFVDPVGIRTNLEEVHLIEKNRLRNVSVIVVIFKLRPVNERRQENLDTVKMFGQLGRKQVFSAENSRKPIPWMVKISVRIHPPAK